MASTSKPLSFEEVIANNLGGGLSLPIGLLRDEPVLQGFCELGPKCVACSHGFGTISALHMLTAGILSFYNHVRNRTKCLVVHYSHHLWDSLKLNRAP